MERSTAFACSNLSGSFAFALKDPDGRIRRTTLQAGYKEALDKAITSIRLGDNSYSYEMRRILQQYADSGIRVADWQSGYFQRLDTTVRRNIMDGLRQLKNEEQKLLGDEFGADGYEISAHVNPAPDHADIQGSHSTVKSVRLTAITPSSQLCSVCHRLHIPNMSCCA